MSNSGQRKASRKSCVLQIHPKNAHLPQTRAGFVHLIVRTVALNTLFDCRNCALISACVDVCTLSEAVEYRTKLPFVELLHDLAERRATVWSLWFWRSSAVVTVITIGRMGRYLDCQEESLETLDVRLAPKTAIVTLRNERDFYGRTAAASVYLLCCVPS